MPVWQFDEGINTGLAFAAAGGSFPASTDPLALSLWRKVLEKNELAQKENGNEFNKVNSPNPGLLGIV